MVRLPHLNDAIVPKAKIVEYLLNRRHTAGRAKARFLEVFGFSTGDWAARRDAIIEHAAMNEVTASVRTSFGTRLEIDGPLPSPDGRNPIVRVVWFVERQEILPRLVTLIPRMITR